MKRLVFAIALWSVLVGFVPAFAGKPPAPILTYPNTKTYAHSCDEVWSKIVPVVAKNALVPESSDRLGGFMRLRYLNGTIEAPRAATEAARVTTARQGRWQFFRYFRVVGGTLTVVTNGDSCDVRVQMEYQVNTSSGWFVLQSNGFLESVILGNIDNELGH